MAIKIDETIEKDLKKLNDEIYSMLYRYNSAYRELKESNKNTGIINSISPIQSLKNKMFELFIQMESAVIEKKFNVKFSEEMVKDMEVLGCTLKPDNSLYVDYSMVTAVEVMTIKYPELIDVLKNDFSELAAERKLKNGKLTF